MTSPLHTKRPITAPGRNTFTRTALSLLGLGLVLAAGTARAQQANPTQASKQSDPGSAQRSASPQGPTTLYYFKEPDKPATDVQPVGAQVLPPPALERGMAVSAYAPDEFQDPIPLGLKDGWPNPVTRVESEANFNRR